MENAGGHRQPHLASGVLCISRYLNSSRIPQMLHRAYKTTSRIRSRYSMVTTLRKRLRRPSQRHSSLKPNTTISSPLDPIDLEANNTFESNPLSQSTSFDDPTIGFQPQSTPSPRLEPGQQHHRALPPATVPLLLLSASLLVMFLGNPQEMLRTVLVFLLFAPYPHHFPRWTILVPLLAPMSIKGRVEVIIYLGLTIWLHVGCSAEWWFVTRRLKEAWVDWIPGGTAEQTILE
jgi:hypothetical protein